MTNCIHIVGNRPQFIKLALLTRAISAQGSIHQKIIHTGQHYDMAMSDVFFDELKIPAPDYQLQVNQLPHDAQVGRMLEQIGQILKNEQPDGVIVYGDTNTTLAGALAAKKNNLPLAHVEAGIRTGDENMPEESNRYLTDRMADLNFCPTYLCEANLANEGFGEMPSKKIFNTGDIMLDAWQLAQQSVKPMPGDDFVLATIHREENNGSPDKLTEIVAGLNEISASIPVVLPCHPGTRSKIEALRIPITFDIKDPLSYLEMMQLLSTATYVITDSGGFCREAFFSKKPTLVIMQHPFWPEVIALGTCIQTQAKKRNIVDNFAVLRHVSEDFETALFGDGKAASRMAAIIEQEWKK